MLLDAANIYGSHEWLEQMQGVLIVGWLLLAGWWAWQLISERPDKPKAAQAEQCKLHMRPLADCPPGSHPGGTA